MVFDLPKVGFERTGPGNARLVSARNLSWSDDKGGSEKEIVSKRFAPQRICHREPALGRAWRSSWLFGWVAAPSLAMTSKVYGVSTQSAAFAPRSVRIKTPSRTTD
jgi:hypothetical protein